MKFISNLKKGICLDLYNGLFRNCFLIIFPFVLGNIFFYGLLEPCADIDPGESAEIGANFFWGLLDVYIWRNESLYTSGE